jgi:hypothetical protein
MMTEQRRTELIREFGLTRPLVSATEFAIFDALSNVMFGMRVIQEQIKNLKLIPPPPPPPPPNETFKCRVM